MLGFHDSPVCEECPEWLTGRQSRYCSPRCRQRAYRRARASTTPARLCVLCGAEFRPVRGKQTYCDYESSAGPSCAAMQEERQERVRELDNARWDAACAHCGRNVDWEGVGRPRRYCSPRCRTAFYRAVREAP